MAHKSVVTVVPKRPEVKSVSVTCSVSPGDVLTVTDLSFPRIYVTIKGDTPSVVIPREQMLEFCRAVIKAIENTPDMGDK